MTLIRLDLCRPRRVFERSRRGIPPRSIADAESSKNRSNPAEWMRTRSLPTTRSSGRYVAMAQFRGRSREPPIGFSSKTTDAS